MELDYTGKSLQLFVTSLQNAKWTWPASWNKEKRIQFIDSVIECLIKYELYEDIKVLSNVKKKINL